MAGVMFSFILELQDKISPKLKVINITNDKMLEYYLHIDPSTLTDEEWAEKLAQLADIRKKENGGK